MKIVLLNNTAVIIAAGFFASLQPGSIAADARVIDAPEGQTMAECQEYLETVGVTVLNEPLPVLVKHKLPPGRRVQFHPATDLWMQGARFGAVIGYNADGVRVKPDNVPHSVHVTWVDAVELLIPA
jgi:hypothetical protein